MAPRFTRAKLVDSGLWYASHMIPSVVYLGPVPIHLYGVILGVAIVAGAWTAAAMARREQLEESVIWDGLVWVLLFGVVGARLYHVVDLWSFYRENLGLIVQVWRGGLGIFGAMLGGIVGAVGFFWVRSQRTNDSNSFLKDARRNTPFFNRLVCSLNENVFGRAGWLGGKRHIFNTFRNEFFTIGGWRLAMTDLLSYADAVAFGMPVGQAIGRWGNYVNQELYGLPTDLPWAIFILPEFRVAGYEAVSHFHPLFLYEALWSVLSGLILLGIYRWKGVVFGKGFYFTLYLIFYSLGRILLEPLKIDPWRILGVPTASLISIGLIVIGSIYVWRSWQKTPSQ